MQHASRRTVKVSRRWIMHAACLEIYRGIIDGQERQGRRWIMQPAGRWTGKASRRWIMQHAGRWTEAGQEMDRATCPQMDKGKAEDGSYSMPAGRQKQGRRWIIQHISRWTETGQEMDHTPYQQMDRGRAGDGSYSMRQMDRGRKTGSRQCCSQQAMLHAAGKMASDYFQLF
jgi:hypothetical protein